MSRFGGRDHPSDQQRRGNPPPRYQRSSLDNPEHHNSRWNERDREYRNDRDYNRGRPQGAYEGSRDRSHGNQDRDRERSNVGRPGYRGDGYQSQYRGPSGGRPPSTGSSLLSRSSSGGRSEPQHRPAPPLPDSPFVSAEESAAYRARDAATERYGNASKKYATFVPELAALEAKYYLSKQEVWGSTVQLGVLDFAHTETHETALARAQARANDLLCLGEDQ